MLIFRAILGIRNYLIINDDIPHDLKDNYNKKNEEFDVYYTKQREQRKTLY